VRERASWVATVVSTVSAGVAVVSVAAGGVAVVSTAAGLATAGLALGAFFAAAFAGSGSRPTSISAPITACHASRHRAAVVSDMNARSASVFASIVSSFASTRAARVYLFGSRADSDEFDDAAFVVFAIFVLHGFPAGLMVTRHGMWSRGKPSDFR
jgi:hypothetical protein